MKTEVGFLIYLIGVVITNLTSGWISKRFNKNDFHVDDKGDSITIAFMWPLILVIYVIYKLVKLIKWLFKR